MSLYSRIAAWFNLNIIKAKENNNMSTTKEKKNYLSRTAMVDLMKASKGHFMTVTFITNEGDKRVMNCKVKKDATMTNLGYLNVREVKGNQIKSVNTRTLQTLKIGGVLYTAKIK